MRENKRKRKRTIMRKIILISIICLIILVTHSLFHMTELVSFLLAYKIFAEEHAEFVYFEQDVEFIHITRTGGAAIEAAASKHGLCWAVCHFECTMSEINLPCPLRSWKRRVPKPPHFGEKWHVPPRYWKPDLLDGKKTFTVVRNPYDRVIGEYYHQFGHKGVDADNAEFMNAWIQNMISDPERVQFLPQYEYVFDKGDQRIIDHVLRFENLTESFNELMKVSGLPPRLKPLQQSTHTLTVTHFTKETIRIINNYAAKDFEAFGYIPLNLSHDLDHTNQQQRPIGELLQYGEVGGESGCLVAHYKHKSDAENDARAKAYHTGMFMSGKLETESEISRRNKCNKLQNLDMLKYASEVRRSMQTPLNVSTTNHYEKGFFALVTMFQPIIEASYMEEWLHWYILQGVDHFYLYANEDSPGSDYVFLRPFLDIGIVTLIPWPNDKILVIEPEDRIDRHRLKHENWNGVSLQHLAMVHFLKHFKSETIWIIKVDVDEYTRSLVKDHTLRDHLIANPQGVQFLCPVIEYGSSYHEFRPEGLLLESYLRTSKRILYNIGKVIAKTEFISEYDTGKAHFFKMTVPGFG